MANIQLTQTGQQVQKDLNLTENLQDEFSTLSTYSVGAIVIYDSKLWKCHTAVSSAGSWTGTTNWTQIHLSDLSGMSNPMTDAGDIIVGGSSGTPTRLAKGTDGQVLKMISGAPAWASGGGGAQLYNHQLEIVNSNMEEYNLVIVTPSSTPITTFNMLITTPIIVLYYVITHNNTVNMYASIGNTYNPTYGMDAIFYDYENETTIIIEIGVNTIINNDIVEPL